MKDVEHAILSLEARSNNAAKCACGEQADWRCDDCFGRPEECQKCCAKAHERTPWHKIGVGTTKDFIDGLAHAQQASFYI